MNSDIKKELESFLKEEATKVMNSDEGIKERLHKMNDITNLYKILDNYDELELVIKRYFREKYEKKKWGEDR